MRKFLRNCWETIDAALLWLAMEPAGRLDTWRYNRRQAKRNKQMSDSVTWDGKNFAAIQGLLANVPRTHGRPCYEIAPDWSWLTVTGKPVLVGQVITLFDDGSIIITTPLEDVVAQWEEELP